MTLTEFVNRLTMTRDGKRRGNNFLKITLRSSASSIRKNGEINGLPVVNKFYKNLVHVYTISAQTGFDYEKRLNKILTLAGEANRPAAAPVNGHIKVAPQLVAQKNGNIGIAVEVLKWLDSVYVTADTGETVSHEYLAPFKRDDNREVDYLTPNLCNIVSVQIDGECHEIDASDYESVKAMLAPSLADLAMV